MAPGVSPARRAAHTVALRVLAEDAYADRALQTAAQDLEGRDRALAKQLAFGVVQRRGTLDWVITRIAPGKQLEFGVRTALHIGLYELLFLNTADHAAIAQAVELAKPSPGHKMVNAVLRRVQREGIELPEDATPAGAAVRHSHPEWLVKLWWKQLGADATRALLAADNEPAELALRINTLAEFDEADLPPGRREGDALVVEGPFDVAGSPAVPGGCHHAAVARAPSAWRRSSPRSRASASWTSARRPAARRRTWPRSCRAGARSSRSSATPVGPGRCEAACRRMHARQRDGRHADAKHFTTGEAVRPCPRRPAVLGPGDAADPSGPALEDAARRTSRG